jgi:hypothetical protein
MIRIRRPAMRAMIGEMCALVMTMGILSGNVGMRRIAGGF